MKQIWITHVHILCSKTLKRQEVWEKSSKRKRVRKWNVCISFSPQVVQVFVAQTKDLVHISSTSFPKLASLQINLELVP
jgi:hypothetical protein